MAPIRAPQARNRPRRAISRVVDPFEDLDTDELGQDDDDEPPLKRMRTSRSQSGRQKWIPGGRGGGGRHVEMESANFTPVPPDDTDEFRARRPRPRPYRSRPSGFVSTPRSSRPRRTAPSARPRYSTATAAAAAVAHGDGYKPREERGWEEFHPDLDLDSAFAVLDSREVDGIKKAASDTLSLDALLSDEEEVFSPSTGPSSGPRKRPGRPPRGKSDPMLNGLLDPQTPKVVPPPGPNPRERLTLPKPSYRTHDPFLAYEEKSISQVDFVDRNMASVGYQESEIYLRPDNALIRMMEGSAEEDLDLSPALNIEGENSAIGSLGVGKVEYDMDEQDVKWLDNLNKLRKTEQVEGIKPAIFEITMTKIEKEWHALEKRIPKPNPKPPQTQRPRSSSAAAVNGEPAPGEEQDSKCAICDDGDCENANAIVFCDGCDLAVHQECYGVPYIPEGQWLCRKCQLIGRATPTCIFCPNTEGAFKQTNSSKWAHLLCATWIPEVNLGNTSLMEPVVDVEKVPANRWKLGCYICEQKMGASIQCSHKSCYQPFHPTCARRSQLYLKMKSNLGANSLMDQSQLRAYCDKHVPADWGLEHNTEHATEAAKKHYKHTLKGQKWADSRASALALVSSQPFSEAADDFDPTRVRLKITNKSARRAVWRMPSGAPVIPEVILKSIEGSLTRFNVRRKKEYIAEACKYWTLKREARRGAALLKRLQLQMDTFSSFEVTRRSYVAQGAAGRARLERRISFAEQLAKDLAKIREICESVKERELEKLKDTATLREIVDIVYFPVPPLLWPIFDKVLKLDTKDLFRTGLSQVREKLETRSYTSVGPFSADLAQVFAADLGVDAADTADLQAQVAGRGTDVDKDKRDKRTLAKRIVKAIQPALEEALRKESELNGGRPYASAIKAIEEMAMFSRRASLADSGVEDLADAVMPNGSADDAGHDGFENVEMADADDLGHEMIVNENIQNSIDERENLTTASSVAQLNGELTANAESSVLTHTPPPSTSGIKKDSDVAIGQGHKTISPLREPPTPPISYDGQASGALQGGIPWYLEAFDPEGTTIYDERWTGKDALRQLSEELSEMDEDELQDLGGQDFASELVEPLAEHTESAKNARKPNLTKKGKQKRRWRGFK